MDSDDTTVQEIGADAPDASEPNGRAPERSGGDSQATEPTQRISFPVELSPGEVLDDRFQLQELAGSGGMGTVYRALDLTTDALVALKILHDNRLSERFEREAEVLSVLSHPSIVEYVAHGETRDGARYLATAWLRGKSLAALLSERKLDVEEATTIGRMAAEALGHAHRRGIIHRDVKPANLFLLDGEAGQVRLLDFGIARHDASDLTASGVVVGTWSYMSPEQAMGSAELDARTDIFSLGCVLYECLSGRKAFESNQTAAVLVKILLEEPAALTTLRSDVPPALSGLVMRMLSKERANRPWDGRAVVSELDSSSRTEQPRRAIPSWLTVDERQVVSVVLARMPDDGVSVADQSMEGFRQTVSGLGGRLDFLVNGTAVIQITGTGSPAHQAACAARCAVALGRLVPDVPMALATGMGVVGQPIPTGQAIDRGAAALESSVPGEIRLDHVAAGLLDQRFAIGGDDHGPILIGEYVGPEPERLLLGKPTPCVGRKRELATLEAIFDEVVSESVARAALVVGQAGVGKSRLLREFQKQLDQRKRSVLVLHGRGDPVGAGSPFGLLTQAIREMAGIREGEPLRTRQAQLGARLALVLSKSPTELRHVTHFLGEMIRVPFTDLEDDMLREARSDPMLMGDRMRTAFETWIAAECRVGPVLLVLEDLQWGDLPTVQLVEHLLRALSEEPIMAMAVGRPQVLERFPELWRDRDLQTISVPPLTRRASERLVTEVLGDKANEKVVEEIVDRAQGNAFYLEELIRVAAEGDADVLPETVLGMAQARFAALGSDAKRVIRAGSIFGKRFWVGAVRALVGISSADQAMEDILGELVTGEVVSRRQDAVYQDQVEYEFRHVLLRDAAYAMLTDEDQQLGHRLAARWLEEVGETDPITLAGHFDRGGDPERAATWYCRAAEQALEGKDYPAAIERAERGLACGGTHEESGTLNLLAAEAHRWLRQYPEALNAATRGLPSLPRGGGQWFHGVSEALLAASALQEFDLALDWLHRAAGADPTGPGRGQQIRCLCRGVSVAFRGGRVEQGRRILEQVERLATGRAPREQAWVHRARAVKARHTGAVGVELRETENAIARFEEAGDDRQALLERASHAHALAAAGDVERADRAAHELIALGDDHGLPALVLAGLTTLGKVAVQRGSRKKAVAWFRRALVLAGTLEDRRRQGLLHLHIADVHLDDDVVDAAEREARAALDLLSDEPVGRPYALATTGRVLMATLRVSEAGELVRRAKNELDELGVLEEGEAQVRLAWAQLLTLMGEGDAALDAVRRALDRIGERAGSIEDEALRQRFLENVPIHARTRALCEELDDSTVETEP